MTTTYQIEVMRDGSWTTEGLGDDNAFGSEDDAQATLDSMLAQGIWDEPDRFRVALAPNDG